MKYFVFSIIVFTSVNSYSDTRSDKVRTLMEAQGLLEMFQQQLAIGRSKSKQQAKQILDQIIAEIKPVAELKKPFEEAFKRFMTKTQSPWTAEEIVSVWAQYYGAEFSDKELDELIDFYTSEIGVKEVGASRQALVKFTSHFQKASEPIMQKAMQDYIQELKAAAAKARESSKS